MKNALQPSMTLALPVRGVVPAKKIASSEMKSPNLVTSRSAIVRAKAVSAAQTWSLRDSPADEAGMTDAPAKAAKRAAMGIGILNMTGECTALNM